MSSLHWNVVLVKLSSETLWRKRSYFGIETDIHKTADGKFVVIHDETTERVSGGAVNINVESVTRDEIEKVTLPDIDGSKNRADIKIPFLKDYIKICKKCNFSKNYHFFNFQAIRGFEDVIYPCIFYKIF